MAVAGSHNLSQAANNFLEVYSRAYGSYDQYAKKAKTICDKFLEDVNMPPNVTCRTKDQDRLRKKLETRQKTYPDESEQGLFDKIRDLAGVRIAVYFPDQKAGVDELIRQAFDVKDDYELPDPKAKQEQATEGQSSTEDGKRSSNAVQKLKGDHLYAKRFGEYRGHHYHVLLHEKDRPFKSGSRNPWWVEVQLVTVLSSVWSQVQHDIVYKQLTGKPSEDELRIIDGFNGLVGLGELLLEQLYRTHHGRKEAENTPFANKYELGHSLQKWMLENIAGNKTPVLHLDPDPDPIRALLVFLQTFDLQTPRKFSEALENLGPLDITSEAFSQGTTSVPLHIIMELVKDGERNNKIEQAKESQIKCFQRQQCSEALQIIASTIMWIDELFRCRIILAGWETTLFSDPIAQGTKDNLAWLLRMEDASVCVTSSFTKNYTPKPADWKKIEGLWGWLSNHANNNVQFAFGLSCYGMRKLQSDIHHLQSIGSYLIYSGLLPKV
ncbi:MAG: hypothetical protein LQ340_007060 [Diploschistes diacapsis]|nr:MAG: hypothetical protein LQ340_007060 [Diploschistes diacapsis]